MTTAEEVLATPIGFTEHVLGMPLYCWQDRVISWFADPRKRVKASVAAPNGSGKDDRVIAALSLWWLFVHARGKVVITSKDSRQLDEQTMTGIRRHADKFHGWVWNERQVTSPTGGRIILFTTDEAGRAEGWHKEDDVDGPLLIIVNEAKSVPDDIFTAFDRCTYNGLLYISSAGLMSGRFYESQTRFAADFRRETVRLEDCPHIPAERVADILKQYGPTHWFTRSTLYSEFISQDDQSRFIFPLQPTKKAMEFAPVWQRDQSRSAFCDFAAGGDENVLAIREGNRVEIIAAWRETDTMAAVGQFILKFRAANLTPEEIFGDYGGLGRGMMDRLWEMGWKIGRVNFGGKPRDTQFKNLGCEMWGVTAASVVKGEIGLPNDPLLLAQLTTRPAKIWSDGKIGMISKDEMRAKPYNLPSPDRGDAVCGAWTCRGPNFGKMDCSMWNFDLSDQGNESALDIPAGMHAG